LNPSTVSASPRATWRAAWCRGRVIPRHSHDQRRRHIWSLLAGGPESGIYKSTDGGESWQRIDVGLPEGDMGKIGLAVTAADPDIVYAIIEANDEERGFYRSLDKGRELGAS